jgi:hypothetical protein
LRNITESITVDRPILFAFINLVCDLQKRDFMTIIPRQVVQVMKLNQLSSDEKRKSSSLGDALECNYTIVRTVKEDTGTARERVQWGKSQWESVSTCWTCAQN